jgi:hypothetical protein
VKTGRADPQLRRQIEEAAERGKPVAAVFTIQTDPAAPPPPSEVEARVARLLEKVREQTGQQHDEVQVFGNIGSFAVTGPAEFVAGLARQPEVASATSSEPEEDILIRPIRRRPVAGPQTGDRKKPPRRGEGDT